MAQQSKQKTLKSRARNRYHANPVESYANMSAEEAMDMADDDVDAVGKLPSKGPKRRYTPKPRKAITVKVRKPVDRRIQPRRVETGSMLVDGNSLNFGELFNSIVEQDVCGVPVMTCPDAYYVEKLTGGNKITVRQAKEIASKLKFMADSVNQQVYETLESRRMESHRTELVDLLKSVTSYVLCGAPGPYTYIVPVSANVTGDQFYMEGVAVMTESEKRGTPKDRFKMPTKLGTFSCTYDLDDISTVPKNGDDDQTKLVFPFGTVILSNPDSCLPEITQMSSSVTKILHRVQKAARTAK